MVKLVPILSPFWTPAAHAPFATALRVVRRLAVALRHRCEVRQLAGFDDRMLKDIGLSRSEVEAALAEPLHRDPSAVLWVRHRRNQERVTPDQAPPFVRFASEGGLSARCRAANGLPGAPAVNGSLRR